MAWAHPRSRGENRSIAGAAGFAQGSSPLTRGKPPTLRERGPWLGLIPAHAGKTSSSAICSLWTQAHPRSRGENFTFGIGSQVISGSSPLTRGKLFTRDIRPLPPGLIPAHAGKTPSRAAGTRRMEAHPRSRGENWSTQACADATTGSSPLTRGKRTALISIIVLFRLIPAHAGKTPALRHGQVRRRAHPRSRGENTSRSVYCWAVAGSSPLTRGKPRENRQRRERCGLIPAHAGKTPQRPSECAEPGAHPRSRGENEALAASDATDKGSSPLTRGKH